MTEREKILGRIREALTLAAPFPGHHGHGAPGGSAPVPRAAATEARRWLPPVGPAWEEWLALFARNSEDLRTDFRRVADREAAMEAVRGLAAGYGWKKVATHGGGLAAEAAAALGLPTLNTDGGYEAHELEQCDAGITGCEALVAQTGSLVVTARTTGGRALSVLPPHHVVLATPDRLVPDLPAAYDRLRELYGDRYPSMIGLVTGPSRTGDIERILVLGAHGPKRLTVLLIG